MAYEVVLYTKCGVKARYTGVGPRVSVVEEALAVAAAQGFMVRGMVSRAVVSI